jgi:prepilin-type N-terminal cleavage/methylation domain-containing protein
MRGTKHRVLGGSAGKRRGFTLVELMVVAGMVVVLLAIFVPYVSFLREGRNRVVCADNLRQINRGLQEYADENAGYLPRTVYDVQRQPLGWTAWTGADSDDPFVDNASVKPNDVTASLWLLVRTGKLASTGVFVCPSTDDRRDGMTNERGMRVEAIKRGNFRGAGNLSYSYSNPFSLGGYKSRDRRHPYFVIVADRNPGKSAGSGWSWRKTWDVTDVKSDSAPLVMRRGNSRNHGGAGQNVLYALGAVEFVKTPFCGDGRDDAAGKAGDNIYTALRPTPLEKETPPANEPGVIGEDVGPAWPDDAYLVPYAK